MTTAIHFQLKLIYNVQSKLNYVKEIKIVCYQILHGISLGFNATFNNISAISWQLVLLVEETRENHRPATSH